MHFTAALLRGRSDERDIVWLHFVAPGLRIVVHSKVGIILRVFVNEPTFVQAIAWDQQALGLVQFIPRRQLDRSEVVGVCHVCASCWHRSASLLQVEGVA